jgi:hypothetical protein
VSEHAAERDYDERDEELSAVARTLHREWHSPRLWPSIAAGMLAHDLAIEAGGPHTRLERFVEACLPWPDPGRGQTRLTGRWQALAAAAVIALTLAPTSWLGWRWFMLAPKPDPAAADVRRQRLLTVDALAAIERSEAHDIQAIDDLTRLTASRLEAADSPLLVNLRDRLEIIDTAIAEYRTEIARNRFNAHLRQQLLWIYQEKRRTLEQIQEYAPDAL